MAYLKKWLLYYCLATIGITSCAGFGAVGRKEFSFQKDNKNRKLIFTLPRGKSEEQFRLGDKDAREQFYYFGNGSVFYVARHTTWQTINQHRIMQLSETQQKAASVNGKDSNGLHWKEINFEEFKIGYAYVGIGDLEKFNEALNGIKIR